MLETSACRERKRARQLCRLSVSNARWSHIFPLRLSSRQKRLFRRSTKRRPTTVDRERERNRRTDGETSASRLASQPASKLCFSQLALEIPDVIDRYQCISQLLSSGVECGRLIVVRRRKRHWIDVLRTAASSMTSVIHREKREKKHSRSGGC